MAIMNHFLNRRAVGLLVTFSSRWTAKPDDVVTKSS